VTQALDERRGCCCPCYTARSRSRAFPTRRRHVLRHISWGRTYLANRRVCLVGRDGFVPLRVFTEVFHLLPLPAWLVLPSHGRLYFSANPCSRGGPSVRRPPMATEGTPNPGVFQTTAFLSAPARRESPPPRAVFEGLPAEKAFSSALVTSFRRRRFLGGSRSSFRRGVRKPEKCRGQSMIGGKLPRLTSARHPAFGGISLPSF